MSGAKVFLIKSLSTVYTLLYICVLMFLPILLGTNSLNWIEAIYEVRPFSSQLTANYMNSDGRRFLVSQQPG